MFVWLKDWLFPFGLPQSLGCFRLLGTTRRLRSRSDVLEA